MKLIVGLGNPGSKYENTRHNIGFMFVDYLADRYNTSFTTKKNYQYAEINVGGEKVILLKPQTFMNLSGEAVKIICDFYKLTNEDILVIYDDLDMSFGKLRVKFNSSSGGHNGIKNIISHLHTQEFMRIKVGINNEYKRDVKTFVLSKFSKEEIKQVSDIFYKVEDGCNAFITGKGIEDIRKNIIK